MQSTDPRPTILLLIETLQTITNTFQCETDLQNAIETLLSKAGISYRREVALSRRDRPDFMVETVALEVKTKGSPAQVTRQLYRYAEHESVGSLLLVTTLAKLRVMPEELRGKPVVVTWIPPF